MISKEKSFVSIVFYVRNFAEYIEAFIDKLMPAIDDKFEYYEFICVNNDSTDESINIIKKMHSDKYPNISLNILTLSYCRSIEEAMSAGIDLAIGDFVYEFESILIDYEVDIVYKAYLKSLEGNDVVFVSPNKKVRLIQKLYYIIYNFGVKKEMKIYPERFKLFSRRAINRVGKMSKYFSNNTSILNTCGLDATTIFYTPSNEYIKYDKEEKNERIIKALESLIIHTNSIQYMLVIVICLFFFLGLLVLMLGELILGSVAFLVSIGGIFTLIVVQYIHILLNMTFKNKVHLIKSINKVVK